MGNMWKIQFLQMTSPKCWTRKLQAIVFPQKLKNNNNNKTPEAFWTNFVVPLKNSQSFFETRKCSIKKSHLQKFCGMFTLSPPLPSTTVILVVTWWQPSFSFSNLKKQSRPCLQIIVYLCSDLSWGYMKDWCKAHCCFTLLRMQVGKWACTAHKTFKVGCLGQEILVGTQTMAWRKN